MAPPPGKNPSDGDEIDDVEVCVEVNTAGKADKRRDDILGAGAGGPTIINLPPTIISGASPCPYCDVRTSRPQSSLSEAGGSSGGGYYAYAAPHFWRRERYRRLMLQNNLSLSVPALQQIYPPLPLGFGDSSGAGMVSAARPHYCSPYGQLLYERRKEMLTGGLGKTTGTTSRAPPPPNMRPLRRRNTWHVPKDYLEQITTSV